MVWFDVVHSGAKWPDTANRVAAQTRQERHMARFRSASCRPRYPPPLQVPPTTSTSSGNGSLMRIALLALAYLDASPTERVGLGSGRINSAEAAVRGGYDSQGRP